MKRKNKKRGRPQTGSAKSAAERMRAYRRRKREAGYKTVTTWVPEVRDVTGDYSDHQILDARSLALHCKIVRKISDDPTLISIALDNIERWRNKSSSKPPAYLDEWQKVLELPWPQVAKFITSMSDDATRLRSSSPFAGILSDSERKQVYAAFRP